jgi:hypothetical protein
LSASIACSFIRFAVTFTFGSTNNGIISNFKTMKTKIAIIATGVLLSAGVAVHVTHHCPLQQLKANVTHTAPAPANSTVKPAAVDLH